MSVFSSQLFISPERPVDPLTLSILELIDGLLRDAKIHYMLVGATARDLLLYHVFGHAVTRATYDLDFAILVDSWEQFAIVRQLFLDIPGFTDKGRNAQRLTTSQLAHHSKQSSTSFRSESWRRLSEQSPGHPTPISS
jgi:predicted nucleotidyltransferase